MLNLLDSHDTGRILSLADGDSELVILALALLLTMPGAPCIYYGTEVDLEGGPDPDSRRGFPWDRVGEPSEIGTAIRELIAIRRDEPGLRSGDFERIGPAPGPDFGITYLFARGDGSDRVVVALNHADEADVVPLGDSLSPKAVHLWGDAQLGPKAIDLPPRSVGIWKDPR